MHAIFLVSLYAVKDFYHLFGSRSIFLSLTVSKTGMRVAKCFRGKRLRNDNDNWRISFFFFFLSFFMYRCCLRDDVGGKVFVLKSNVRSPIIVVV